jgi:CheY-like chemotaxis protein
MTNEFSGIQANETPPDARLSMPQTHVLFLEDEDLIRAVVVEALVEAGFRVTEACNGEAALDLLEETHRFDLLLADVHMPGRFNGMDVARRVRTSWPGMPVVFVTARPDTLHAFGMPSPRDRCVMKPYRPTEVLEAIHSSLAPAPAAGSGPVEQAHHRQPPRE